jgi:hypothetical protein
MRIQSVPNLMTLAMMTTIATLKSLMSETIATISARATRRVRGPAILRSVLAIVGIAIATAITGVIVAREIETATETEIEIEMVADEIDTVTVVTVATVVTEIAIEASAI